MNYVIGFVLGNLASTNGLTLKPKVININKTRMSDYYYSDRYGGTWIKGDWEVRHYFLFSVVQIGKYKEFFIRPVVIKFNE